MAIRSGAHHADLSKAFHLGHSASWDAERLEESIARMEQASSIPPVETLLRTLQKCRERKSLVLAKRLHAYIRDNGLHDDVLVGNHLVPVLVDCGSIEDAELIFKRLPQKTEHSWTSLILWHAKDGNLQQAFHLYRIMQEQGVCPSSFTLVALLKSCTNCQDVTYGRQIHTEVMQKGFDSDPFVGSTLIGMYMKCKLTAEAQEVFNKISRRDVVLWTSMIAGFAEHGPASRAFKCFLQMQNEGHLREALKYLESMASQPDLETWRALLNACKMYGGVELASTCFDQFVQMNPDLASSSLLRKEVSEDDCFWEMASMRECGDIATAFTDDSGFA